MVETGELGESSWNDMVSCLHESHTRMMRQIENKDWEDNREFLKKFQAFLRIVVPLTNAVVRESEEIYSQKEINKKDFSQAYVACVGHLKGGKLLDVRAGDGENCQAVRLFEMRDGQDTLQMNFAREVFQGDAIRMALGELSHDSRWIVAYEVEGWKAAYGKLWYVHHNLKVEGPIPKLRRASDMKDLLDDPLLEMIEGVAFSEGDTERFREIVKINLETTRKRRGPEGAKGMRKRKNQFLVATSYGKWDFTNHEKPVLRDKNGRVVRLLYCPFCAAGKPVCGTHSRVHVAKIPIDWEQRFQRFTPHENSPFVDYSEDINSYESGPKGKEHLIMKEFRQQSCYKSMQRHIGRCTTLEEAQRNVEYCNFFGKPRYAKRWHTGRAVAGLLDLAQGGSEVVEERCDKLVLAEADEVQNQKR